MSVDLLPVITLWQPWASLCFTRDKRHETRGFAAPAKYIGRRIVIHSAVRVVRDDEISPALHLLLERNWGAGGAWRDVLPFGCLLGTFDLVASYRTEDVSPDLVDRICGNWSPGRFAWELANPIALRDPLTATGRQGWWSVDARLMDEDVA